MKKCLAAFLSVVFVSLTTPRARADSYPTTPKALMETYLRLDADAAGLSPATWPELGQFTSFPQAPKWNSFIVIDHYDVGRIMEGHTRAKVQVLYYPLGQFSDKFTPGTAPESVAFFLVNTKDQWKVDTSIMPHVSYDVLKKRLNAASAANIKEKPANDAIIAQIESVRSTLK